MKEKDQLLLNLVHAELPQTQCTKCGFPDCRSYAEAIIYQKALHNRCQPGGQEGINRLSKILQRKSIPLDSMYEEKSRSVAKIDPYQCIGCTICIQICPVDAIVGASKQLHMILEDWCTGCDLCILACPVDCITLQQITEKTGWDAWNQSLANQSLRRYESRNIRLVYIKNENDSKAENSNLENIEYKNNVVSSAISRAQSINQLFEKTNKSHEKDSL